MSWLGETIYRKGVIMLDYDIEKSILELSLRKTGLQREIEEIDLQIAFLIEQKEEQEKI